MSELIYTDDRTWVGLLDSISEVYNERYKLLSKTTQVGIRSEHIPSYMTVRQQWSYVFELAFNRCRLRELLEIICACPDSARIRKITPIVEILKEGDELEVQVVDLTAINQAAPIIASFDQPGIVGSFEQAGIVGALNQISVADVESLVRAARSVCRVFSGGEQQGTGFLIEGGYVCTAMHVFGEDLGDAIQNTTVEFGLGASHTSMLTSYRLDKDDYECDQERDIICVRVVSDEKSFSVQEWGSLVINFDHDLVSGTTVHMIHHPNGNRMQLSMFGRVQPRSSSLPEDQVLYNLDTAMGSSGAPVFNEQMHVVALHKGAFNQTSNRGVSLSAVNGIRVFDKPR